MGDATSQDILLGILYATGAIVLLIAGYMAFIKRFKRAKLEAISQIELITSHNNIFVAKTQFLLITPQQKAVKLSLLTENQEFMKVLLEEEFSEGEHTFYFDPENLEAGKYYLSLETEDTNILRRIFIKKETKPTADEII